MTVLLPIITGVASLISFLLMLRDIDDQKKALVKEGEYSQAMGVRLSLPALIYSILCIILTVVIAVFFPKIYPDNSVWVNIKRMVLLAIIWPIAYIDLKTLRIPNLFVIYGLICRGIILVFEFFLGNPYIWQSLLSEAIASGALLLAAGLCALVVKNGIGFGDMKLFIVMGLMLSLDGIWSAVFLALVVSFFIALFVLITKKKSRKDAIPFGPALVIGTFLSICLSGM